MSDSVDTSTGSAQDGIATLVLPMVLWVATLAAIVTLDIGAYLVAAARAQSLADAAALAAVSADVVPDGPARSPLAEAQRLVDAGAGRLDDCVCTTGSEVARVTVSVPVPGLVIPTLGASRVAAEASAMLAPPGEVPAGPSRARVRWPRPP